MSEGSIITRDHSTAIATLTEANRRALVVEINHKAAVTAGVEALAVGAMQSGDIEGVLENIADITAVLSKELRKLAVLVGELKASHAA
ncbi:hypothetical protein FBY06_14048 [Pseudomonas sp. SJZ085]|uniref:hypothetical protein n=1 Tax=unclassified Pseudomonas TaxID=196821 RepID=UPI0011990EB7|nr:MULTISPECIES: hypothetical protein [unclassified Pseudomonas]TWC12044.1 hypothetical protein FBX99_13948 [Pseudomonas sp. SJZ074]TWC30625.1 hypothetical protein FBY06_14048 [Pseudomonas sp. SJZ085]